MKKPTTVLTDNIIHLFADDTEKVPEQPMDVSHMDTAAKRTQPSVSAVDLTGKPKILMAVGAGNTGKTTLLRYIFENALEKETGAEIVLASVDPINRELGNYFPGAMAPDSNDAAHMASWLERFIGGLLTQRRSGAIDFGGGDVTLSRLVGEVPDLQAMMESAGVEPVMLYLLSPRVTDFMPVVHLERARFQPRATALVLNMGRAEPGDVEAQFATLRRHSEYQKVLDRGAVEVWMPRLHAAKAVESRRIGYRQATNWAQGKDGLPPLNMFDRSRVANWLDGMERAFSPISSWLL